MRTENKRFHLQLIEDTIIRMSSNSFLIKGWSVTILSGLITLYITKMREKWSPRLLLLGIVVCIIFWINDTYYLYQEHRFRSLYEKVRKANNEAIDFNMEPPTKPFCYFLKCMFRPIFCWSYLVILVLFLFFILHEFHIIIKF